MSRRCAEQVQVRRGDEAPEQFVWRGRLYLVRSVLSSWVESGGWWRSAATRAVLSGDAPAGAGGAAGGSAAGGGVTVGSADDLVVGQIPSSPKWGQRAWGEPAPDIGVSVGPAAIVDGEREFWRVEAGAGRSAGIGVYDLCFDWGAAAWSVVRVLD